MKKRIISLILTICMVISVIPNMAFAEKNTEPVSEITSKTDDELWAYEEYNDGVVLTQYYGTATDIYVPSLVEIEETEYAVIKLGDSIFENNDSLNSVTLGSGIKEIGARAFYDADNLVCILTSQELTIIDDMAFYSCDNFNSIILYDAIESIGTDSFAECPKLTVWCNEGTVGYTYVTTNNISYEILNPNATPETVVRDGITYYIMNGEAIAVGFDESVTDVVIPNNINGYAVTELRQTFRGCDLLTNVTLPNTIKIIGEYSFYSCPRLTNMVLPDSVTYIGDYAFSVCHRMTEINIPNQVTYIGSYCFHACYELLEVVLPDSVTRIGYNAFMGCSNLQNVKLSRSLTEIPSSCFSSCSSLVEIEIPSGVTYIGGSAFNACTNLKNVTIPETVTTIQKNAFKNCSLLEKVVIPQSVIELYSPFDINTVLVVYENSYAHTYAEQNLHLYYVKNESAEPLFYQVDGVMYYISNNKAIAVRCTDNTLTTVTLPSEVHGYPVTELRGTFKNCSSLTTVVLPNSITTIDQETFSGCTALYDVNIPYGVTFIGKSAFSNCSSITEIVIPNSVTSIDDSAFYNCTKLKMISLSDSVTNMGKAVFQSCTSLTEVFIPNSLTSIPSDTFSRCSGLVEITIPNHITTIGSSAFSGCTNIINVMIPDSVENIYSSAFDGCNKLEYVYLPNNIESLSTTSFHKQTILIVYEDTYAHNFVVENELLYIAWDGTEKPNVLEENDIIYCVVEGEAIAVKCKNKALTSVTIPEEIQGYPVTELRYTFMESSVKQIVIPDTLKNIGDYAFYKSKLDVINIPNTVTEIGVRAFYQTNLKYINIPDSVTSLGEWAFCGCRNLKKVVLSNSISDLPGGIFDFCISLEEITIPDSVTTIGFNAFNDCHQLKKVIIPNSVNAIGNQAFYDCTELDTVFIPNTVDSILKDSFASSTILLVYEDSYAHTFAQDNDLLYFIVHKINNPEISYGTNVSGVVTYSDGTLASNATVDILHDDGSLKESVTTDAHGVYEFTYAEVGQYTVRATDDAEHTTSQTVSVKRMNVFDVFVAGDTDLTLKQGWNISGTVNESNATITLTDEEGNIIQSVTTENGNFVINNVPNGSYILKAETENGFVTKEITVFNGDVSGLELIITTETATIWGYVEVEDRKGNHQPRNWVNVTIYNDDGNAVAQCKSDKDGKYEFNNLPLGEYAIVAETSEMRPDKKLGYDRSYTLTGYAYIDAAEEGTYQVDTIILYEENDSITTVSGKVTANGETQDCEVVLRNVFRYEVAKQTTGKNGKYAFKNVRDGLYFITATTKSDGMGYAVVVVRNGRVYGDTHIKVLKNSKVIALELAFFNDVPECNRREDVLRYRERIAREKNNYDALSKKEKKQLSQDYINLLNQYCEWLANCEYTTSEGVTVEQGGLVVAGSELQEENTITFNLSVEKKTKHELDGNGIQSSDDYLQHSMEDAAKKQHDYGILEYYEISMMKQEGDKEQAITSVYKDTDATGKFRITINIPEEYRGYKNYSFVHVHKGEVVTLVDLDDDPNTVTFEVDAFSTFALLATDEEQTGQFVVGDLDNDSDFTELDIAIMRTYLTKKVKSFDFATSDINEDNAVDIRDVIALKRGIVEGTLVNGEEGSEGGDVEAPEEEW